MTGTLLHEDDSPVGVAVSCLFDGMTSTTAAKGAINSESISSNSLLILDQRDLLGGTKEDHHGSKSSSRFHHHNKTNDNNNNKQSFQKQQDSRYPLVLMKLPSGLTLEELCGISSSSPPSSSSLSKLGTTQKSLHSPSVVHFVANGTSSTLICHEKSFQMSTIGTSNALILVPPPPPPPALVVPQDNDDKNKDPNEAESPFAKRRKTTTSATTTTTDTTTTTSSSYLTCPARLVHLGGSGASFMELTRKPLPTALAVWEACRRQKAAQAGSSSSSSSSSSLLLSCVATDLQYSLLEVLQVIRSDLPQVVVWKKKQDEKDKENDTERARRRRHQSSSCCCCCWCYQLLEEDQLLDGQAAVLSTLCESESCSNHEETGGTVLVDQVLPDLVRRLQEDKEAARLHQQQSGIHNPYEKPKVPSTTSTTTTTTTDENYQRLARHFLNLLQTTNHVPKENNDDDGRLITLDPHKVRR
jgi:hypothetical protein